jgi:hypothetical protein
MADGYMFQRSACLLGLTAPALSPGGSGRRHPKTLGTPDAMPRPPVRRCGSLAILALSACLAIAGPRDADAGTIGSLANPASLTLDGLTFTVTGCEVALCADLELTATETGSGVAVEVLGNGAGSYGSNILESVNGVGLGLLDFTLTVAGIGNTRIASVSTTVNGSYPAGNDSDIGALLQFSGLGTCTTTGGYNFGYGCNPFPWGTNGWLTAFGPVSSLSVNYQLALLILPGQTIILSSISQTFCPAVEPASIGVMATGLAGLAMARLRRNRRVRPPGGST